MSKNKKTKTIQPFYKKWEKPIIEVPKLTIGEDEICKYRDSLRNVLSVQSSSYNQGEMLSYIESELSLIDDVSIEYDSYGNIYATRGEATTYPCVVAHTDTVHDIIDNYEVCYSELADSFFAINADTLERTGVGGDDNVGVFLALETIKRRDICKVVFFKDEEVGCIGSSRADMDWFKDVSIALQGDRQGYADFVDNIYGTDLFGYDFEQSIAPLLKKYGREVSEGGLTDVVTLVEKGLTVCTANASCGYYKPHTRNEYVKVNEAILTLLFFNEIFDDFYLDGEVIENTSYQPYPSVYRSPYYKQPVKNVTSGKWSKSNKWGNDYYNEHEGYSKKEPARPCAYCGSENIYNDPNNNNAAFCLMCNDYDYNN